MGPSPQSSTTRTSFLHANPGSLKISVPLARSEPFAFLQPSPPMILLVLPLLFGAPVAAESPGPPRAVDAQEAASFEALSSRYDEAVLQWKSALSAETDRDKKRALRKQKPAIEFYPSDVVNDPNEIGKQNTMVAINSAIQIDLTGQVCSDSIGARFYSGIGGQVDFIRGAGRSRGRGRPGRGGRCAAVGSG